MESFSGYARPACQSHVNLRWMKSVRESEVPEPGAPGGPGGPGGPGEPDLDDEPGSRRED